MPIHSEHPFSVPVDRRDPVRRLRGRLASPVTVLTADVASPAGLTVSSFFVIEGEVPRAAALLGPGADVLEAVERSGAFVAHVLDDTKAVVADLFAGLRPAPGGVFKVVATEPTRFGPRLVEVGDWAGCELEEIRPLGDQMLVVGTIVEVEVSDLADPLVYFRGVYRRLAP